jgi:hypothetical protein
MVLKLIILDLRMWTEGLVQLWTSTQVHYHEYQGTVHYFIFIMNQKFPNNE